MIYKASKTRETGNINYDRDKLNEYIEGIFAILRAKNTPKVGESAYRQIIRIFEEVITKTELNKNDFHSILAFQYGRTRPFKDIQSPGFDMFDKKMKEKDVWRNLSITVQADEGSHSIYEIETIALSEENIPKVMDSNVWYNETPIMSNTDSIKPEHDIINVRTTKFENREKKLINSDILEIFKMFLSEFTLYEKRKEPTDILEKAQLDIWLQDFRDICDISNMLEVTNVIKHVFSCYKEQKSSFVECLAFDEFIKYAVSTTRNEDSNCKIGIALLYSQWMSMRFAHWRTKNFRFPPPAGYTAAILLIAIVAIVAPGIFSNLSNNGENITTNLTIDSIDDQNNLRIVIPDGMSTEGIAQFLKYNRLLFDDDNDVQNFINFLRNTTNSDTPPQALSDLIIYDQVLIFEIDTRRYTHREIAEVLTGVSAYDMQ